MRYREKIAAKMAVFMTGRRGMDELCRFLLAAVVVLIVLSWVTGGVLRSVLGLAEIAALVWCYVRAFSRNIPKRRAENEWYLARRDSFRAWLRSLKERWQQRKDYCFFRCPSCRALLRVPKNRGRLQLTCRKCGNRFERKT